MAIEQFRAQLPTYLSSGNPPDVLTWYAGSVARDYASKGLLLDVSDLWTGDGACASFSPALKSLSSAADGKQIFVPTNYYWWSVFYLKSAFQEWGVTEPTTWDEFIALCDTLKGKGIHPAHHGHRVHALGGLGLVRLPQPADQRRRPTTGSCSPGSHSFDSAEVKTVMDTYATLLPYFDPKGQSYSWQEAVTPMVQKKAGMYLIGAFITQYVPADQVDDLDFFSVPTIDPAIPSAEEAPTDGYFASASSKNAGRAPRNCCPSWRRPGAAAEVHRDVRVVEPADLARGRHQQVLPAGAEGHQAAARDQGRSPSSSTATPATPCRPPRTPR